MHNNARLRFIVIGGVTVALLCILVFSGKRQKQAHYLQRLAELTNALNAAFQNTTRFSRDDLEAGTNLQIQLQEFAGDGYFGELLKAGIIYGQYATQLLAKGTFHFHEGGKRDEEAFKQEVIKEVVTKNESSSSGDISLCKAQMVDGIYVFINSVPSQPYETAFQIETKVAGGFGCPSINDLAKAVVKSARKNGLPFDAVILGSGKIDLAIKFK